jgi:hypothetical protein
MRLFIAREAVDPHLQKAGAMVDGDAALGDKARGFANLSVHLAGWVPGLLAGKGRIPLTYGEYGRLAPHLRFVERSARKLGRMLFYAMARFGPKLERRQATLFRLVDVGAELFAMSAVCVRARALYRANDDVGAIKLADLFCRGARLRVRRLFGEVFDNHDGFSYRIAQDVLAGKYAWIENGIME